MLVLSLLTASPQRSVNVHFTSRSSGTVKVVGAELNYVTEGQGIPCLVIDSSVYYPRTFSEYLRKHLRLYFVDMRWFAKTYKERNLNSFTVNTLVEDVDSIRKALKFEKIVIMGHSIHGTIAFEYAKRHPANVSNLVVIGSPVIFANREYAAATDSLWKTASPERRQLQEYNWSRLPNFEQHPELQEVVENYVAMTPKYWYNPSYPARELWKGMTIHSPLLHYLYDGIFLYYNMFGKKPMVLTLVAVGKFDYIIPFELWDRYKAVPNLTLCLFEKSGHTPQLEEPERFDRVLIEWLKKH